MNIAKIGKSAKHFAYLVLRIGRLRKSVESSSTHNVNPPLSNVSQA